MTLVVIVNLLAIGFAMFLPNDYLAWNSHVLYAFQMLTLIPYLLGCTRKLKNLFLPTFFVLFYFLVNLTFGAYLVPRGFGWYTGFTPDILASRYYNTIVPFLMASNLVLFLITRRSLRRLEEFEEHDTRPNAVTSAANYPEWFVLLKTPLYFVGFALCSLLDVFSAFSFQLAIMIMHLTEPALRRRAYRFGVYVAYLGLMLAVGFENKREIIMVLFLILFLEAYYSRARLSFSPLSLMKYATVAIVFFALVLAASILRGYGEVATSSAVDAILLVPQYISSDLFIDGLTDNLELNYNYGVTITSIDQGLRGLIDYQYGTSLLKWLYLPIPRDALPFKPESMMQMFTRVYAPDWWIRGGSMPVNFASDMFLNFHVFGLAPFALVWFGIDELFIRIHTFAYRSLAFFSCIFLCITVLMFARGSGLELWLLYFFVAAPFLLICRLAGNVVRRGSGVAINWVV